MLTTGDHSNGKTDLDVLLNKFDTGDTPGLLTEDELNGTAGGEGGRLYIWQDANLDGIAQNDEVELLTNIVESIDAREIDYLGSENSSTPTATAKSTMPIRRCASATAR
ncbi:MAG: hypothetical protein GY798_35320 [Hyphomicrobiales bacterium]|nr:hypothetical protein [Hyphomicrobiales bacterium]